MIGGSMRVYDRILKGDGTYVWTMVQTDANGNNEYVYITWLIEVLKLVLGESPFYASWGIPAVQSVVQQIFPDYFVAQVQQQFQGYFSSLIISKVPGTQQPTYNVQILTLTGTTYQQVVGGDNVPINTMQIPVTGVDQLDINFILDQSVLG